MGRTALVTGAGQGIGRAIAEKLHQDGYSVIVTDMREEAAQEVAERVGGSALTMDVTDRDQVLAAADTVNDLDVLVNSAGIFPAMPLLETTPEVFRQVMDVNVAGILYTLQAFHERLATARGSVVNISSMAATIPMPGVNIYTPSKAAAVALTQLAALELAPSGIRVNSVAPGATQTESAGKAHIAGMPPQKTPFIPLGRYAIPDDIAEAVSFLASDSAGYITGQTIYVDGGFSIGSMANYIRLRDTQREQKLNVPMH